MELWTYDEFKMLQQRLVELDMGITIDQKTSMEYVITIDVDGEEEVLGKYNILSQELSYEA